jgi:hypothetical protein
MLEPSRGYVHNTHCRITTRLWAVPLLTITETLRAEGGYPLRVHVALQLPVVPTSRLDNFHILEAWSSKYYVTTQFIPHRKRAAFH